MISHQPDSQSYLIRAPETVLMNKDYSVSCVKVCCRKFKTEELKASISKQGKKTTSEQEHMLEAVATHKNLDYLSKSYDDLNKFKANALNDIHCLLNRTAAVAAQVNAIATAIDDIQQYSYQYNVKIVGLPEYAMGRETALQTARLCVELFQAMGAESITLQDIDIAHRVPTRKRNADPKPVICKFVRRLAKKDVMSNHRQLRDINA